MRGRLRRAGPARGPRTRTGARWAWLGWLGCEALFIISFFVFFFFFLDLNSNLVWVFEFKMGAPNSLEF
jgi:hypothetical protein